MFFEKTLRHVFFGSANSLRVFWRQKGVVYFFIAASWMGVFFDGETCANVFFRTFELFDTMHAIRVYSGSVTSRLSGARLREITTPKICIRYGNQRSPIEYYV